MCVIQIYQLLLVCLLHTYMMLCLLSHNRNIAVISVISGLYLVMSEILNKTCEIIQMHALPQTKQPMVLYLNVGDTGG